jgi:hypothetical protein
MFYEEIHDGLRKSCFAKSGGVACFLIIRQLDSHFMKTSHVIVLMLLLTGCESSRQGASLTTEQVTTMAVRLANDKTSTLYQRQPFVAGQPAQFVAGHWVWNAHQGYGNGDIQARVELAADGSTNRVDIKLFNSQNTWSRFGGGAGGF